MKTPEYAIGIDLGTSNCAVAHVRLSSESPASELHPIRQYFSADTVSEDRTLPSFLFRSSEEGPDWIAGRYARDMSFRQPDRVIHSAKSWLCHSAVDRKGKLLPWQSSVIPASERLSPVEASRQLLLHIRTDWEEQYGRSFQDQRIAITLPASFDAIAQQLTLEAAISAGYPESTILMEEPQAAFYRWLESHAEDPIEFEPGKTYSLLVMDVGGGTSDFSMFELRKQNEELDIRRTAVSDHVLLGGDNMDRFLAERLRHGLEESGYSLQATQWSSLLAESRRLKEQLLTPGETLPDKLTLASAGSGLFADSPTLPLDEESLRTELLEAFFPLCGKEEFPRKTKTGLREIGLPYAADGAVTRHVAAFVNGRAPIDFILCNGGTLSAPFLQERLTDLMGTWQDGEPPVKLDHNETDIAVARGAAVYLSRLQSGQGVIEAGAARSVYVEIRDKGSRQSRPLCILPQGSPPEEIHRITKHPLRVTVDTPVRFQAWSSSKRTQDQPGDLLSAEEEDLHALPALQTQIELPAKGPRPANNLVEVAIEASVNASGLLNVFLVSTDKKWKGRGNWELQFNLRATDPAKDSEESVRVPEKVKQAGERIAGVLGKKADSDPRSARKLFKELESMLSQKRKEWDPVTCRQLWPYLREGITRRNRSKDHEATWFMLAGYCMRPGFGVELDEVRINELWRVHELGLSFPKEARNTTQLWILWRRIAGGLDAERQSLIAKKWMGVLKGGGDVSLELIRLSGALERVSTDLKQQWIRQHLKRLPGCPHAEAKARAWALGGLLGRLPFGGGPEDILPPAEVEAAFQTLRSAKKFDTGLPELQQALIASARITGDVQVDVSEEVRNEIRDFLLQAGVDQDQVRPLEEYVPEEETERALRFGEALPPGLTLVS